MIENWNILKLKQKLRDWNRLLDRLSPPQRRWVWWGAGTFLLLLIYLAVVSPLLDLEESWGRELARQRQLLAKYQSLIAMQARIDQGNQAMITALAQTETRFLSGANPAVASADLQEILKNLAREQGVLMTSAKVLAPRETGPYLEVPIQVQYSGNISQMLNFLYHLEYHKKLLFIPELEINAPRSSGGQKETPALQINMVVSGVIKKGVPS